MKQWFRSKYFLFCLFPVFSFLSASAQYNYDFNDACQKAYKEIIRLKPNAGREILEAEKKSHPYNLIPYFLDNYIDFFNLFFNEDPAEYKKTKPEEDIRLELMKKGDPSSPFYLFTRSVIYYQWAAVDIKFGNRLTAGWAFRHSFLLTKENLQKFRDFQPNIMLSGTMQVAAGTIPPGYKWLSNLLGIHGSITDGMRQLEAMLASSDSLAVLFRNEATFYYLYLTFYIENKKDEVFDYIKKHKLDIVNNHLFTYLTANLSLNGQRAAYAEKTILHKNNDTAYLKMPAWDLEMGYAKADRLDPDAAIYFERFLSTFRGKLYVKDVLQKLSWYYYYRGNMQKANDYRALIFKRGSTDTEADKQALKDAENGSWPNLLLLKARLLDDGGYFHEALQLLESKSTASFQTTDEKLEFVYRMGRIYDGLNRKGEAIASYSSALDMGAERKEYYAARAALQIGYICESRGDKPQAIVYFQKVLDLKDHDYKNSLDQKAKAGLERCSAR